MRAKLTIAVLVAIGLGMLGGRSAAWAGSPYLHLRPGHHGFFGPTCYLRGAGWEELPYFAVYPPVYYDALARGPEPPAPRPLVVINQFVAPSRVSAIPSDPWTPAPQLIKNPYVKPGSATDAGKTPPE